MLELGAFVLELGAIQTSSLNPPNSSIVFSAPRATFLKILQRFLPQQPTSVLMPGVRPARSHRGHARGFKMSSH
jgi:hypothetical protein